MRSPGRRILPAHDGNAGQGSKEPLFRRPSGGFGAAAWRYLWREQAEIGNRKEAPMAGLRGFLRAGGPTVPDYMKKQYQSRPRSSLL